MGRREYFESGLSLGAAPAITSHEYLFELGLNHATGRNADYNLVTAHTWFSVAAVRGSDRAKRFRSEIAKELSKAQLRKAQRAARKWLQDHAAH